MNAGVREFEYRTDQVAGRRADDDLAHACEALQARCEIRCFADGDRQPVITTLADDNQPSRNSDTQFDRRRAIDLAGFVDQFQPGAQRALGIVFVRRRPAEIHQDAVAEVLRDETVVTLDHFTGDRLVITDQGAKVFRVQRFRHCRGPDQVAEHHGEVAALGARGNAFVRDGASLNRFCIRFAGGRRRCKLGNPRHDAGAHADGQPHLPEHAFGQVRQRVHVDIIVDKGIEVRLQPKAFQPVFDIRHVSPVP